MSRNNRIIFSLDTRFYEYQGELYSEKTGYDNYWDRYLEHFDEIYILARVKRTDDLPNGLIRSTGPRVRYYSLPFYSGPVQYFKVQSEIKRDIRKVVAEHQCFILRGPAQISTLVFEEVKKQNKEFVLEIGGDPWEVMKYLNIPEPIKSVNRYLFTRNLKLMAQKAIGVFYVTQTALQRRYPASPSAICGAVSDVFLPDDRIVSEVKSRLENIDKIATNLMDFSTAPIRLGSIGWLYSVKSPIEVAKAVNICIKRGYNLEMHYVGGGPLENQLFGFAKKEGIQDRIVSHGKMASGDEIFAFLDSLDLYIQFSKSEGLPRSLVEALSRGCPCIASRVGGIPELLPDELLVDHHKIGELANLIMKVLNDQDVLKKAVLDNMHKALEFRASVLTKKRSDFYRKIYHYYSDKRF